MKIYCERVIEIAIEEDGLLSIELETVNHDKGDVQQEVLEEATIEDLVQNIKDCSEVNEALALIGIEQIKKWLTEQEG